MIKAEIVVYIPMASLFFLYAFYSVMTWVALIEELGLVIALQGLPSHLFVPCFQRNSDWILLWGGESKILQPK